jgi:hypothetical protein
MTMDSVFPLMLDRFMTLYGAPKTENDAGFIREYALALGGFSDAILERATGKIVASHGFASWPVLGECVRVCREVAEDISPRPAPLPPPVKNAPPEGRGTSILREVCTPGLYAKNSFPHILARCPHGGSIDISAPWGQEVRDARGNVVPIRS